MSNILKCAFHKSTNSRDGSRRRGCRRVLCDLAKLSNNDTRRCNLAIKEGGFTSCQNAASSNKVVFICWVDYVLEGSAFILSKCYFSRMFHTERS